MTGLAASAPILVTLALMVGLRWSAGSAGVAGAGVAIALAAMTGSTVPSLGWLVAGAVLDALFIALTILWILWPALAIHELQTRTGMIDRLRKAIAGPTSSLLGPTLLVAWFLALFFEGAAGFGTPVALAAPLLLALGMRPERALILALVGHAAGVSFGAIGTPVEAQAALVGLDPGALSLFPAFFTAVAAWWLIAQAGRGLDEGGRLVMCGFAYAAFMLPFLSIAMILGPALPTLAGALLGGTLFATVLFQPNPAKALRSPLWRAAVPYLALIALVALTRAIPPLREELAAIEVTLNGSENGRPTFAPLLHPGTLLATAFVVGAVVQRARMRDASAVLVNAAGRLIPVAAALVAMLTLAQLLLRLGMVEAMANGLAAVIGAGWPLAAAVVGAAGTFITGSATASNLLFSELQVTVADRLGLSTALVLGSQTFGAAAGNMIAPHNILAGCATVGLVGREGIVMRATLPIACVYIAIGGFAALLASVLFSKAIP